MSDSGFFKSAMAALAAMAGTGKTPEKGEVDPNLPDKLAVLEAISKEIMAKSVAETAKKQLVTGKKYDDALPDPAPLECPIQEFEFVGRMAWAWEIENSAQSDEINELLQTHKKARNQGQKLAVKLFEEVVGRASAAPAKDSYIDEDGTNLRLPEIPYSPYSDQGAAFMISLTYNWRAMAQEWNAQEQERIKAEAEKQRQDMADYMAKHTEAMIKEMVEKSEADRKTRDHELDALTTVKLPNRFMTSELFSTSVVSESSSGVSKIAAGLALGELKKSKF